MPSYFNVGVLGLVVSIIKYTSAGATNVLPFSAGEISYYDIN